MATNFKDRPMPVFRNLKNYTLFAPAVEEGGKQARLTLSFMDGRPRFTLFTNVSTDEGKGIIGAGYYPEIFFGIVDRFETILTAEPGTVIPVRNLKPIRTDEGRLTGEKIVSSQLNFGKDESGVLYISLIAPGRTKMKFMFTLSEYHQIFKADKSAITEEEASVLVASGWLKGVRKACEIHCAELAPEQADRTAMKPAGEGNRPAPAKSNANMFDMDDDIPM